MKRRAFSLLLSLTLLFSLALPATTAYAEDGSSNKGMEISKTATANQDGSYTITLEAYATGEKVISEITKDVPTDIILVLDQSGSMAEDIGTVSFQKYRNSSSIFGTTYHTRNQDYYEYRHNGGSSNLWHKLADGSYVSVSVTRQENPTYTAIAKGKNNSTSGGATNYWNNRNNLYALVNGEYLKVTVNRTSSSGTYTYTLPDGTQIASQSGANQSPTFTGIEGNVIYLAAVDDAATTYTYTYTDSNENVQTIGTSTGAETVFSPTLYERVTSTSGGGSRLAAIQTAVTNFANAVTAKAKGTDGEYGTTDDINHRIAIIGFASGSRGNNSYPSYVNTELFIGANQYNYNVDASNHYGSAFQDMNTQAGYDNVMASKNALSAGGATHVDLGIQMANGIFGANAIQTGEKRNRVVIVFTDGVPSSWSDYDSTVADNAISQAGTAKTTYGATVYSVGIFSGADATSAGDSNGNDTQKANWFMQKVSSNNGTPRTPSYYLSAADSGSLNNIFQQISDQIESGGTSSTLTDESVVKDIISPQFTLPEGATVSSITLETYRCTGKSGSDYTWSKNADAMGATASISGDQVSVTGFNFSENYVGTVTENGNTSYRGNKLVISFKVQPKAGFLGGNDVITNASAGIYENGSAQTPIMTFEQPTVNVPIEDVTVTAEDKNVYLKGEVTADQLKNGSEISVGDVKLDLSKATDTDKPYGLDPWQTEYVNITVTVKDKDGKVISDKLDNLTEDTTYTVEVTVAPQTEGISTPEKGNAATAKTGVNNPAANIYVFKPELTFKDSNAYYGETIPTNNNYSSNRVGTEKWMHDGTEAVPSEMLGTKPTLDISFTPDESKLENGKYTKQDVPVTATVKIGTENVNDYTTFVHQDCTTACGWETPAKPGAPAFLIHIQTCTLNITKQGGADNESYVFDVFKDGEKYSEVTVWGNGTETLVELPIGTYTISENAGWSWRYTANNGSNAELTAQNPTGSITCVNTKNNNQWLNGFSEVVRNIFGTNR